MKTLLRILAGFAVAFVAGLGAAVGLGWHPGSLRMLALTSAVFALALLLIGAAAGKEARQ